MAYYKPTGSRVINSPYGSYQSRRQVSNHNRMPYNALVNLVFNLEWRVSGLQNEVTTLKYDMRRLYGQISQQDLLLTRSNETCHRTIRALDKKLSNKIQVVKDGLQLHKTATEGQFDVISKLNKDLSKEIGSVSDGVENISTQVFDRCNELQQRFKCDLKALENINVVNLESLDKWLVNKFQDHNDALQHIRSCSDALNVKLDLLYGQMNEKPHTGSSAHEQTQNYDKLTSSFCDEYVPSSETEGSNDNMVTETFVSNPYKESFGLLYDLDRLESQFCDGNSKAASCDEWNSLNDLAVFSNLHDGSRELDSGCNDTGDLPSFTYNEGDYGIILSEDFDKPGTLGGYTKVY